MKILIVCSANSGKIMPFILEQGAELQRQGVDVEYFTIHSKGIKGYIKHLPLLIKVIKNDNFDLVHAHFGLSGALAVLQRKLPVVITFHNGETLTWKGNLISSIAALFSAYTIYVAQHIYKLSYFKPHKNFIILPCGIPLSQFELIDKQDALMQLNLSSQNINILFGGAFDNLRKNVELANKAISLTGKRNIHLIELKGFDRKQVNTLLCAVDLMLLPTKSEGSPQIVKEAMACNCPIVATDVADIAVLTQDTAGCFLTGFEPADVAAKINKAIEFERRTDGRNRIAVYDNEIIVKQLIGVYEKVINRI